MPSLVVIGPQIKEKQRGNNGSCMVPKDPNLNGVKGGSLKSESFSLIP